MHLHSFDLTCPFVWLFFHTFGTFLLRVIVWFHSNEKNEPKNLNHLLKFSCCVFRVIFTFFYFSKWNGKTSLFVLVDLVISTQLSFQLNQLPLDCCRTSGSSFHQQQKKETLFTLFELWYCGKWFDVICVRSDVHFE